MEAIRECSEDTLEEHAESYLPRRTWYDWVHEDVQLTTFKFRWSRLLTYWLNNI